MARAAVQVPAFKEIRAAIINNSLVKALLGKGLKIGLTLMAHQRSGAPLLYTNGAPGGGTPLVWKTLMAHQTKGAPLVTIFFLFFQTY